MKKVAFRGLALALVLLFVFSAAAIAVPKQKVAKEKVKREVQLKQEKEVRNKETIKNQKAEAKKAQVKEFKGKILLNKKEMKFDVPPVIKEGRTLIPVRAIMNGFGATVTWDEVSKAVYVENDGVKITILFENTTVYVNEKAVTLDVPAQIVSNRTYVPLRFLSEVLGKKVEYDEKTGDITIEEGQEEAEDDLDETEPSEEDETATGENASGEQDEQTSNDE
ncbi:MAG: hypothetical protein PWP45_1698 [Tepidanaerobacteraceae bacterium]|nr:hypothetical protein [Tepidanaerobacteraceae bacterium]